MLQIIDFIQRIIKSEDISVLIRGETGTGKELLSRIIHYQSASSEMPFVEVNCSAIPENLLESELFGYEPGAFTDAKTRKKGLLELAEGGTLFLDEIGLMSLNIQAKLLKAIEDKTFRRLGGIKTHRVQVRIITATNKNLEQAIDEGLFREDLYYRLNMISIQIPPLRERGTDCILLANFFLKLFSKKYNRKFNKLQTPLLKKIQSYSWPGNVRELKNAVERAVLLSEGTNLEEEYLFPDSGRPIVKKIEEDDDRSFLTIRIPYTDLSFQYVEKTLIEKVLKITKGNKNKAARLLKFSRPRLIRKMRQYNL